MRAWYSCTGAELLARDPLDIAGRLAGSQASRGYTGSAAQQNAWLPQIEALRIAVQTQGGQAWTIALEYELLRLEKRIDAVVLTDRAIFCLEFKTSDASPAALAEAEDYALDLRDFHAGSRQHPIIPILVAGDSKAGSAHPATAELGGRHSVAVLFPHAPWRPHGLGSEQGTRPPRASRGYVLARRTLSPGAEYH